MKHNQRIKFIVPVLLGLFSLSACLPVFAPPATPEQGIYTAAAQTIVAEMTLSAGSTAVAQLTQISGMPATATIQPFTALPTEVPAGSPTNTPIAQVATETPTPVPSATPTLPPTWTPLPTWTWTAIPPLPTSTATRTPPTLPPPPTAPPVPCDWVQFVRDVSIPDGTELSPGQSFSKVWRLRNIGSCTWNGSYSLVYVNGDRMHTSNVYSLPGVVYPGETVDVSANFIAPSAPGRYRSYWMLSNAYGRTFGMGSDTQHPFWVDITVRTTDSPYGFDFAANMCNALWSNGFRNLPCPGNSDSEDGSVILLNSPVLETGKHENEPALWTRPESSRGGMISGTLPAFKVQGGDRFMADIGCLDGYPACDVTFYLDYKIPNQPVRNLAAWQEVYDGRLTRVDVDLSALADLRLQFILRVVNNGRASAAQPFWLVPSTRRQSSGADWDQMPAVQASVDALARGLDIKRQNISVVQVESYQWPDTCLGFYRPGQVCAPAIVLGYRVTMQARGQLFEAHASDDGEIVYWIYL